MHACGDLSLIDFECVHFEVRLERREKKPNMKVVILGGGIIGCSVLYQLCKRGVECVIVDRVGIAG